MRGIFWILLIFPCSITLWWLAIYFRCGNPFGGKKLHVAREDDRDKTIKIINEQFPDLRVVSTSEPKFISFMGGAPSHHIVRVKGNLDSIHKLYKEMRRQNVMAVSDWFVFG